jgi:hypothetical protein
MDNSKPQWREVRASVRAQPSPLKGEFSPYFWLLSSFREKFTYMYLASRWFRDAPFDYGGRKTTCSSSI